MISEMTGRSRAHEWHRWIDILTAVAILAPLLLAATVMGAQATRTGGLIKSQSPEDAHSISVCASLWPHQHRFYLPPLNTVNWD